MDLREALKTRVLILDGAMGTRLQQLGFEGSPPDLACLQAPGLVKQIHAEYRKAGRPLPPALNAPRATPPVATRVTS